MVALERFFAADQQPGSQWASGGVGARWINRRADGWADRRAAAWAATWRAACYELVRRSMLAFIASFSPAAQAVAKERSVPPCRTYRNLSVLMNLKKYIDHLEAANSERDIKAIKESLKPFKLAYNDLIVQTRTGLDSLKKATKNARKLAAREAGPQKQASKQANFWEKVAELAKPLATLNWGDYKVSDALTDPVLLAGLPTELFEESGMIAKTAHAFSIKFKASPLRTTEGKGERVLKGESLKSFMENVVDKTVLKGSYLEVQKMQAEMAHPAFIFYSTSSLSPHPLAPPPRHSVSFITSYRPPCHRS